MKVKICGLTNIIDAQTAVDCGADKLGFVMGGWVQPAEIEPHAQKAREIIRQVPSHVTSCIVTHLLEPEDILALADYVGATGIQISEDIGQEKVKAVRQQTDCTIIKTVVVDEKLWPVQLEQYQDYCDYILLDSHVGGYTGGTGQVSDWDVGKQIVEASDKPVYLAGGLSPDNVIEGIQKLNPAGVDVSTGVSCYSMDFQRKDRKSPEKIKSLIEKAKGGAA